MFEINLIPNVKLKLLQMQKLRNVVIFYSVIVAAVTIGVIIILLLVLGGEKITSNVMSGNIDKEFNSLKNNHPGLTESLTLQNQMKSIDALSKEKKMLSRMFAFLEASMPKSDSPYFITLSSFNYNKTTNSIVLEGQSDKVNGGYAALDAFIKIIERTGYRYVADFDEKLDASLSDEELKNRLTPSSGESPILLLDGPVAINETSYGRNANGGLVLRFNISFTLDPGMLDFNKKHVVIEGPSRQIVTDSYVQLRNDIFGAEAADCAPDDTECQNGGQ